jgi:hypothetical protein
MVVVVAAAEVVVVAAKLDEPSERGVASELQPMNPIAHTTTAARRIIEST